jgi:hypothetical protein
MIDVFCYTTLLRTVRGGRLMDDSLRFQQRLELVGRILSAVVRADDSNLLACGFLHPYLPCTKPCQRTALKFHEVDIDMRGVIIGECDEKAAPAD